MIAVNLINKSVVAGRRRRRRLRQWFFVLMTSIAVGSVPVWLEYSRRHLVRALTTEKELNEQLIASAQQQTRVLDVEVATIRAQLARANALRAKRTWSGLIATVTSAMPDAIWMTSLATVPSMAPAGDREISPIGKTRGSNDQNSAASIVTLDAPREMDIQGYALRQKSIYDFVRELESGKMFANVRMTNATEESLPTGKAIRFHVRCSW